MIKVSVLYPNKPGAKFDMDYYVNKHVPLVQQKLGSACKSVAVEQGISPKASAFRREDGDVDGAAESFILYLNSTPPSATPDRLAAQQFLQQKFNIQPAASTAVVASVSTAP